MFDWKEYVLQYETESNELKTTKTELNAWISSLGLKHGAPLRLRVCKNFVRGLCNSSEDECEFIHPEHGIHIKSGIALFCYNHAFKTCWFPKCRSLHRSTDQIEAKKETCLYHKKYETTGPMINNTRRKRNQFQSLENLHESIPREPTRNESNEISLLKQEIIELGKLHDEKDQTIREQLEIIEHYDDRNY